MARTHKVDPQCELRIITREDAGVRLRLLSSESGGCAEIFGAELARETDYAVPPSARLSVYSWNGCFLEIEGPVVQAYEAPGTCMADFAGCMTVLDAQREIALLDQSIGPRVVVVGPPASGKSTLCQILLNYALRAGWHPMYVNLSPFSDKPEALPPGSLLAMSVENLSYSRVQLADQNCSLPMSTTKVGVFYGRSSIDADRPLYSHLCRTLAGDVLARLEGLRECSANEALIEAASGLVVDCPSKVPPNLIADIVCAFDATTVLVLDDAFLRHSLMNELPPKVTVVPLAKGEGASSSFGRGDYLRNLCCQHLFRDSSNLLTFCAPTDASFYSLDLLSPPLSALPVGRAPSENVLTLTPVRVSAKLLNCIVAFSVSEAPESAAHVANVGVVRSVTAEGPGGAHRVSVLLPVGVRMESLPSAVVLVSEGLTCSSLSWESFS
eukprot:Polyplicarium_translucidae@DN3314_c0_g1_i10.p1